MIKIGQISFLIASFFLMVAIAFAQDEPQLDLKLSRNVGYSSSLGSQYRRIQGSFTVRVQGPENLDRVEFYLGEQLLGHDNEAPFALQIHTDSYPEGVNHFSALGFTTTGQVLQSNIITAEIVSPADTRRDMTIILVPLFGVILLATLFSAVVPALLNRGKRKNTPEAGFRRNYGISGGGICSRCQRPFPFAAFSPNFGPGLKLTSCPYCGKFGIVRRRSLENLRSAEEAELIEAQKLKAAPDSSLSEDEKLRKELDESRYQS